MLLARQLHQWHKFNDVCWQNHIVESGNRLLKTVSQDYFSKKSLLIKVSIFFLVNIYSLLQTKSQLSLIKNDCVLPFVFSWVVPMVEVKNGDKLFFLI